MWDWVPIVFVVFKVGALAIAMFYAVKWHYDQGERRDATTLLRSGTLFATGFVILLLFVGSLAYFLSSMLGLDLSLP